MRSRILVGIAVSLCAAAGAWGDSSITVGNFELAPDTPGQTIQVYINGDDQIAGVDLVVQVDNGYAGPAITWIDMVAGTIFADNHFEDSAPLLGDGVTQPVQYAACYMTTDTGTVLGNGLLATITLDTTGFTTLDETWDLKLTQAYGDSGTVMRADDSTPMPLTITNGSVTITPEPATLSALALGALSVVLRRRRRPACTPAR